MAELIQSNSPVASLVTRHYQASSVLMDALTKTIEQRRKTIELDPTAYKPVCHRYTYPCYTR